MIASRKSVRRGEQGFSLIELLIVVGIMLILAAIAIPSVIASVQAGHESAAVGNLRQVQIALVHYREMFGNYPASGNAKFLGTNGNSNCPTAPATDGTGACLLSDSIAAKIGVVGQGVAGYTFAYTPNTSGGYLVQANPLNPSQGRRSYTIDDAGTVVWSWGQTPPASTVVDNSTIFSLQ